MNFWEKLPKPIMILAPMEGVTDTVFRQIVASVGRPDVFLTEFVPVDAILFAASEAKGGKEGSAIELVQGDPILSKSANSVLEKSLQYSESERPIVAQIWGTDPNKFFKVAQILKKLKFDGIDINMGCPERNVIKRGACSGLIKSPKLAKEIIMATIKGAGGLPVSVKTRIGFNTPSEIEVWTKALLETPISALTLHLRTVREMSKVPAHWELIEKVLKARDELNYKTLIIGNGDIKSLKDAKDKCREYGIDGVMIGRGIFENVYLFDESVDPARVTSSQKIELLLKHLYLFKEIWGDKKHFELMKKFVKCYVNNFDGASEKREGLMKTKTLDELLASVLELK